MAEMTETERRALVEKSFAPELRGEPLIENRLIRRQCFIGSGTRLAMAAAAALFDGVREAADIPCALAAYETQRRPIRERFRDDARLAEYCPGFYARYREKLPA
jgi:hypothetical protein